MTLSGWNVLVSFGSSDATGFQLSLRTGGNDLVGTVSGVNGTGTNISGMQTVWSHFVLTCDASGSAKLYINGVLSSTASVGSAPSYTITTLTIGDESNNDMYVSDIRLYKTELTAQQVAALYNQETLYMQTVAYPASIVD